MDKFIAKLINYSSKFHNFIKHKTGYFIYKKSILNQSTYRSLIGDINVPEASEEFIELLKFGKKFKKSMRNTWSLIQSLEHIYYNNIEGVIVESGVYEGNSLIIIEKIQRKLGLNKQIYGYDTFEGMVEPSNFDNFLIPSETKVTVKDHYKYFKNNNEKWLYKSLSEVKDNLFKCLGDTPNIKLFKGDVRNILSDEKKLPQKISLLRLDTDFYESTKKELEILFPRLVNNGILIIDDYGYYSGSKKAVDEYFKDKFVFKHYIDKGIRLIIKSS